MAPVAPEIDVGKMAKKRNDGRDRCRIAFDTHEVIRYGLRLRSVKTGKSISEILNELCEAELQEEMKEYQKNPPETTADPRGRKKKGDKS